MNFFEKVFDKLALKKYITKGDETDHTFPRRFCMRKTMVAMMMMTLAMIAAAQIPVNGLVAYFPFTGNYNDESGSNVALTARTPAVPPVLVADRFSTSNSAYSLNGTSNSFRGIDSMLPMGNTPRTISLWVNPQDMLRTIISYGKLEATKHFELRTRPGKLILLNGKDSLVSNLNTSLFNLGMWGNIVMTYDGTTTRIYIQGSEISSTTTMVWNTEPQTLVIGANFHNPVDENLFYGKLDDIAIYKRALSAAQISAMYQAKTYKNTLPNITSTPVTIAQAAQGYSYTVTANDPDSAASVTYTLSQSPTGMTILNGVLTWVPSMSQVGINSVKVVARDNIGDTVAQSFNINVEPGTTALRGVTPKMSWSKSSGTGYYSISGRKIVGVQRGVLISNSLKSISMK